MEFTSEQECIPVGYVLPASVAVSIGGGCLPLGPRGRGVSLLVWGCASGSRGEVVYHTPLHHTPPFHHTFYLLPSFHHTPSWTDKHLRKHYLAPTFGWFTCVYWQRPSLPPQYREPNLHLQCEMFKLPSENVSNSVFLATKAPFKEHNVRGLIGIFIKYKNVETLEIIILCDLYFGCWCGMEFSNLFFFKRSF